MIPRFPVARFQTGNWGLESGNVMDAAYLFARNFVNTRYENLPPEVVEATKKEILDLLGVALGGMSQPGATHVCELVKEWGGKEESSIIGSSQKVPAPNAAQANATMAHALISTTSTKRPSCTRG
jgi:2-methylcitrate dehydratase PrpD